MRRRICPRCKSGELVEDSYGKTCDNCYYEVVYDNNLPLDRN